MAEKESPSCSRLRVEDGSIKPDRAFAHAKGRVLSSPDEGALKRVEVHRFKDGKLVAKNGVPLPGQTADDNSEAESEWTSNTDY